MADATNPETALFVSTARAFLDKHASLDQVRVLHDEFAARGVAFAQPLTRQGWGGTDFHVGDPDGNVIAFVQYG